jgi:hypothetical protein
MDIQALVNACRRPRHLRVDQWYDSHVDTDVESRISYRPSGRAKEVLKAQKAKRRLERWWHKETDNNYQAAPSAEKFAEAKRQRFTMEGKRARITRSLTALNQAPHIRLTPAEWRQIVEDPDLEDQSS